jgi:hypothetical protein
VHPSSGWITPQLLAGGQNLAKQSSNRKLHLANTRRPGIQCLNMTAKMTANKEAQFPRTVQNMSRLSVALPQRVYRELGVTEKILSYWIILRLLLDQGTFAKHLPSRLCQMLLAKLGHSTYNTGISRLLSESSAIRKLSTPAPGVQQLAIRTRSAHSPLTSAEPHSGPVRIVVPARFRNGLAARAVARCS